MKRSSIWQRPRSDFRQLAMSVRRYLLNDVKANHRIATQSAAAALIAVAAALIAAGAADAQSIMRSPNLNISSRTPTITARINPSVGGRTAVNTATITGRGANIATTTGNIAGRGTIVNTAVGRTTTNVTT